MPVSVQAEGWLGSGEAAGSAAELSLVHCPAAEAPSYW